jgi:hypothetical protein
MRTKAVPGPSNEDEFRSQTVVQARHRQAAEDYHRRPHAELTRRCVPRCPEDHFAGRSLVRGSHDDIDRAIDVPARSIDPSRYATPCADSLPSRKINTRMDSPGRTAGFIAFASSFTFRMEMPWTRATFSEELRAQGM